MKDLSAADVGHLDLRRLWRAPTGCPGQRAFGRVAIRAGAPHLADPPRELRVGSSRPQQRAQVLASGGEQARVEPALGGQPGAGAARAEGLADGVDEADLAGPVAVAPARGDLAGSIGRELLERPSALDCLEDLRR